MTTTPTQELVKALRLASTAQRERCYDATADLLEEAANALEQAPAGRVPMNLLAEIVDMARAETKPLHFKYAEHEIADRFGTHIPPLATPTLQDTGVTVYPHPACMEPDGGEGPCRGYLALQEKLAALTPRPQPDEREMRAAVAMAIERADNISIEDGYANGFDEDEISDWGLFLADAALAAMRRLTHPSNTPKTDTGGK